MAVQAAFTIWRRYSERAAPDRAKAIGVRAVLLTRPRLVEGAAAGATQASTQYIMMFCLPLLLFAQAWVTGTLAAFVVAVSMVDRWWLRLSTRPWYTALVRSFAGVVAMSFAFGVFFPKRLDCFYPALGAAAIIGALPWSKLLLERRPRLWDLAPAFGMAALVSAQAATGAWLRVPLLSIWLAHPALGTGLVDRNLTDTWPAHASSSLLVQATANGEEVCCHTPVVFPSGVAESITHEWLVNGDVIDRIELPPVAGEGNGHGAFRTFSCKEHLPPAASIDVITCRVYLDGIYLGRAETTFDKQAP